jgi:transposase-like protein
LGEWRTSPTRGLDAQFCDARVGPRRKYATEEKLRIVEEARAPGASVADVARGHGINANIVFGWRQLAQRGLLRVAGAESAALLPVKVDSPWTGTDDRLRRSRRGVRALGGACPFVPDAHWRTRERRRPWTGAANGSGLGGR